MGGRVDPREIFSINPTPPPPTVRDLPLCACVCVGVSLCHCRVNEVFHSWRDQATNIWTLVIVVPLLIRGWWGAEGTALRRHKEAWPATHAAVAATHKTPRHACKGGKKEKLKLRQPDIFFLTAESVHSLAILIGAPCQHRATF